MGARAGSEVANALYLHICGTLRGPQRERLITEPVGPCWNSLGSDPLTYLLGQTTARWYQLPHGFVVDASRQVLCESTIAAEHQARFDRNPGAVVFMLSGNQIRFTEARRPNVDLMHPGCYFRWLLEQSLGRNAR